MTARQQSNSLLERTTHPDAIAAKEVLLGCAPAAGLYHRALPTEANVALFRRAARAHGISGFDTAPWYGTGRAESELGLAFRDGRNSGGNSVYAITKVGRVVRAEAACDRNDPNVAWGDTCYVPNPGLRCVHDYTAEGAREAFRQSRERLGAAVPVRELRLHDADTEPRFAAATAPGGALEALLALREEGAITGVSLGLNEPAWALRFLSRYPRGTFQSVMLAGCWQLLDQTGLPVLRACAQLGVDVHLAGVFGAGLLWGRPLYKYAPANPEVAARRDHWAAIAASVGVSLPALAVRFALDPAVVARVAVGCATETELDATMAAVAEARLMPGDVFDAAMRRGAAAGLLAADALAALGLERAPVRSRL